MRKTNRRKDNYKLTKEICFLVALFLVCTAVGTYLNKVIPNGQTIVLDSINDINAYYSSGSDINAWSVAVLNLKQNIMFLGLIALFSLFVFTFPLGILSFILKGISIGYTINSSILVMKLKSAKIILLILARNFILIPGAIILLLVSYYYILNIREEYKRGRKEEILFLSRRHILNSVIIIGTTVVGQLLLNLVYVGILQFLVR